MKIKSIKKIENTSKLYDIQTTTENFFANGILVHNSSISNVKRRNNPVTKAGRSDVAKMVDIWFSKENYKKFNKFCESNNWTASYEFCSLRQRIVVEYKEENLVLTAVRDNITGEYIYDPDELKEIGKEYDIPVVDSYLVTDQKIEDIISETRNAEGIEGYVVRFEDGSMYKIKSDEYIRFHNAVSRIKQEKDIVKIILNDEIDDILPILMDKDRSEIRDFADRVVNGINETTKQIVYYAKNNYSENQKDWAINVLSTDIGKLYGKFILKYRTLFDGKNDELAYNTINESLRNKIMKETMTGTRLDNIRWAFGGHNFHKVWVEE